MQVHGAYVQADNSMEQGCVRVCCQDEACMRRRVACPMTDTSFPFCSMLSFRSAALSHLDAYY